MVVLPHVTPESSDETILELYEGFNTCTLTDRQWTHTPHLLVALCCVRAHGGEAAIDRLRSGIRALNSARGKSADAYHETITLAWVRVIASFLAESDRGQALSLLAAALVERCGAPSYLFQFYTRDTLLSLRARTGWVPPDLQPLPGLNDP